MDIKDINLITKGMNEFIEKLVTDRVKQEVHLRLNEVASRASVEIVRRAVAEEVAKRVKVEVKVYLTPEDDRM